MSAGQDEPRQVKPLPRNFGRNPQPPPPRSLFSPADKREVWLVAEPLENYDSTHSMMTVITEAFRAHQELYETHGVLHRNIAPQNIMRVIATNFDKDSPQSGAPRVLSDLPNKSCAVLLDLDHAAIENHAKFYFGSRKIDTEAIMETIEAMKIFETMQFPTTTQRTTTVQDSDPPSWSDCEDSDVEMELSDDDVIRGRRRPRSASDSDTKSRSQDSEGAVSE